jgi:hypothetical protein
VGAGYHLGAEPSLYNFLVFRLQLTNTEPALDLQPSSDTGHSDSDNLTADNTPTFDLASPDAYYRVYRDGQLVSPAYATGATWTSPTLPDGSYTFTLKTVDAAGNESVASPALTLTIDTAAPKVLSALFDPNPNNPSIRLTFNEDVSASLTPAHLLLKGADGNAFPASTLTCDAAANTATFRLPSLPEGRFIATLAGAPITDEAGNSFDQAAFAYEFTRLVGDIDNDADVDHEDFTILFADFGATHATGSRSDLNGDSKVDFADFQILEKNFGRTLPPLPPLPPATPSAAFSSTRIQRPSRPPRPVGLVAASN